MSINALVRTDTVAKVDETLQFISFMLDAEEYGVEVSKVREIIRMTPITKMPNAPPHVEGIINLRSRVIPVVSIRRRFNLEEKENSGQTRIIIMDVSGTLVGIIVDAVLEVIRIKNSEIQPPPSLVLSGGIDHEFITGVVNNADQMLIIVDVNRMFLDSEREDLDGIM